MLELQQAAGWSLKRIAEFGYVRAHATKDELRAEVGNTVTIFLLIKISTQFFFY